MPTPFWTSKETLDRLNRLDRPGFAMEFLRRNPEYRNDCARVLNRAGQGKADAVDAQSDFAHRWGLRFCP